MSVIQTPSQVFQPGPPPDRFNSLAQGLVGAWPIDEGAGTSIRDVVGHSHGSFVIDDNETTWEVDRHGPCLRFPFGAPTYDDYVTLTNTGVLTMGAGHWSASAWVRATALDGYRGVVVFDNDGVVFDGARAGVLSNGNVDVETTALSTGIWYHLVAVYAGDGNQTIYVNGLSILDAGQTESGYGLAGVYAIGRGYGGSGWYGDINKVLVWNRALTPSEVQQLYADPDAWRRSTELIVYTPVSEALEQLRFRWRGDDGDEDEAVWVESEGDKVITVKSKTRRLRVQLDSSGNVLSGNYRLQYRKVGDSVWLD